MNNKDKKKGKMIGILKSALHRVKSTSSLQFMAYVSCIVLMLVLKSHLEVSAGYLPSFDSGFLGNTPDPSNGSVPRDGIERLENAVYSVLSNVRMIFGAVIIAIIVYAGSMMALRGDDEAEMTKQKSTITYAIIGMAVIAVAGAMTEILSVSDGGFLNPDTVKERAVLFRVEVNIVITFIKYFLGSLATLFLVIEGLKLIMGGSDESTVTESKKKIAAVAMGLLIVIFSSAIIDRVFYVLDLNSAESGVDPQIDAVQGLRELISITNIVVTFVGPVMILMLIIGGFMYILSAGDDGQMDKAKKLITNAVIGIVVIYGAFAIVATFISGQIT